MHTAVSLLVVLGVLVSVAVISAADDGCIQGGFKPPPDVSLARCVFVVVGMLVTVGVLVAVG